MNLFKMLFIVFKGFEDEPANGEEDLTKALDENLKKMEELQKSKAKKNDIREMMKDPETRKKVKELMDDYDEDDEEEEEEEDETKKSFDAAVSENEDIIDAVPVLKSFVEVLSSAISKFDELKSQVKTLQKSQEDFNDVQKSMTEVISSEIELVKSMTGEVKKEGEKPQPIKGVIKKSDLLEKSFNGNQIEGKKRFAVPMIREALLKSAQSGEIDSMVIAKWEMNGYRQEVIPANTMAIISKYLPKEA